jgi:hypothetical protein
MARLSDYFHAAFTLRFLRRADFRFAILPFSPSFFGAISDFRFRHFRHHISIIFFQRFS